MTAPRPRCGGQILVDELRVHGVTHAYCVPGESYLPVLDALHDAPIALTVCRQEGGAAMMAEAHGKLTGAPGICFVTRGPGATNATAGLHVARQDSTPMILFIGQVARGLRGREAFQELDHRALLGPLTKWSAEIDDPARIPESLSHAFHVATGGRPGPVALVLPEDVLREPACVAPGRPAGLTDAAPSAAGLARFQALLASAARPLLIAGGGGWDDEGVRRLAELSTRAGLPVCTSFRRQGAFPSDHANAVGHLGAGADPALIDYARRADLIVLLGTRLSEMPSQSYTLLDIPVPRPTLVHIHPGSEELGHVYRPDLAFCVTPRAFLAAAATLAYPVDAQRLAWLELGRAARHAFTAQATPVPGRFNLGEAICALREELPGDAIVCNGAGNYALWVHRFHHYRGASSQLAPTSGSMGYGLPAAIAAQRLYPARRVVAYAGDGCFLMHGQEFATAILYALPIVVIVVDNGLYGTIRMHQEREYPGRVVGTRLANPDFAAYARAFGGYGEQVTETAGFLPAYRRAVASGRPAILHCLTDPEAITPTRTLSGGRV